MIINSLEDFINYVPTAADSQWDVIRPYVQDADTDLKNYFTGNDLYRFIQENATVEIKDKFSSLICYKAYFMAIPFVDLIETPNGFAVVSNNNLAPASRERVGRLLEWCEKQIANKTDDLIIQFIQSDQMRETWSQTSFFTDFTNCLFFTGFSFASYTKNQANPRKAFLEAKNDLLTWQQNLIEPAISKNFLDEIFVQLRSNSLTNPNKKIVHLCRMFLGKMYADDACEAQKLMNRIEYVLESSLDIYSTYANSEEYALKIAPKYQNKKMDPTFFFGL